MDGASPPRKDRPLQSSRQYIHFDRRVAVRGKKGFRSAETREWQLMGDTILALALSCLPAGEFLLPVRSSLVPPRNGFSLTLYKLETGSRQNDTTTDDSGRE